MNWKALAAAGTLVLAAGSANAGVTFFSYGVGAKPATLLTDFSGDTPGLTPLSTAAYTWSTGAVVFDMAMAGPNGAEPAFSATTRDTGNFLSVTTGQSITLTLTKPVTEVEIYLGSLDSFNTVAFGGAGTYTGAALATVSGADNGNQMASNTNGIFDFTFGAPVSKITFSSGGNSFEVARVLTGTAVPEPGAWAMMTLGLFGLGAAMRYGRRNQVAKSATA